MTSPDAPLTAVPPATPDDPHPENPVDVGLPALLLIQAELPDLARTAIALAKSGNTTALALCFRLAQPRRNLLWQLAARLAEADDDTLCELGALLDRHPVV